MIPYVRPSVFENGSNKIYNLARRRCHAALHRAVTVQLVQRQILREPFSPELDLEVHGRVRYVVGALPGVRPIASDVIHRIGRADVNEHPGAADAM